MKKKLFRMTALVLCVCMCSALFAGCGGSDPKESVPVASKSATKETKPPQTLPPVEKETKPRPTKPAPTESASSKPASTKPAPIKTAPMDEESGELYAIDAYFDNDTQEVSMYLAEDFTCVLSNNYDQIMGVYYFEDTDFYLDLGDGDTYTGYLDEFGDIYIDTVSGYFYMVDSMGYYPNSDDGDPEGTEYSDVDVYTTRYCDYDSNLSITYPNTMTNFEDDMMMNSVLLSDNLDGYVLALNVTDAYWEYPDTDQDFLTEIFNTEVIYAFEELYGSGWDSTQITFLEGMESDSRYAIADLNMFNSDYDIYVLADLYEGEDGHTIIAMIYFSDWANPDQLDFLYTNVSCREAYED